MNLSRRDDVASIAMFQPQAYKVGNSNYKIEVWMKQRNTLTLLIFSPDHSQECLMYGVSKGVLCNVHYELHNI